ncbi:MAG: hypothetical protein IPI34_13430, partial [bacterium]|nr:hypothetical protein [bacterium]
LDAELNRYLAADQRLGSAAEDPKPALRLTIASVLLFALERPRLALDAYLEVAAAPDSTAAVREFLQRTALVYRDHLGLPDSAAVHLGAPAGRVPGSPQAFVLREGRQGDLYTYLTGLRGAAARDLELAAGTSPDAGPGAVEATGPGGERPAPPPAAGGRRSHWRDRKLQARG